MGFGPLFWTFMWAQVIVWDLLMTFGSVSDDA